MANDNFFNSTFDDFFEDISSFSLPTPSWDPMSSFPALNNHLGTLEPPLFPSAGSRSLSTAATFPPPPSAFFNGVSSSFGASSTAPQRTGPGSGFMSAGPAFPRPSASHPPAPTFEQLPSSRSLDRRPNPITNPPLNTNQPPFPLTLPPLPNNSWMPRDATPPQREPNSDDFLNELLSRDFSSPSIPSQTPHRLSNVPNLPPPSNLAAGVRPIYRGATPGLRIPPVSRRDASALQAGDNSESDPSNSIDFGLPEMSSHARSGRPKRVMRATELTLPESSGGSSRTINGLQPPQTRQSRRNSATSSPVSVKGKRKREESEDLFGEKELEVVDLVDKEEVPEDIRNEKPKNSIKLGAFQCVICMDDVTDLTVTYCGHLFCAECLHHALNIDATKRVCPICRQKIENRPANGKFLARAKGYFPLELKLTTKKNLRNLKG